MVIETSTWETIGAATFKPDYIDIPSIDDKTNGATAIVVNQPDRFAILPDATALRFLTYFPLFVLPLAAFVAYSFVRDFDKMVVFIDNMIMAIIMLSAAYFMASREFKRGAYIEVKPQNNLIRLPRYRVEFSTNDVDSLQWITSRSKPLGLGRSTDLNLIVKTNEGKKHRYLITRRPTPEHANQLAKVLGVPVKEIV